MGKMTPARVGMRVRAWGTVVHYLERPKVGTLAAFSHAQLSTLTTVAPSIQHVPVNDHALTQTGALMTMDARIQVAKAKALAARKEAENADEEVKVSARLNGMKLGKTTVALCWLAGRCWRERWWIGQFGVTCGRIWSRR